jgi:hypothetical protein
MERRQNFMRNALCKAAVVMGALSGSVLMAAEGDPVTLVDTGANVTGHINAAILALGSVAAVAVAGYFAFMVIKRGIRWASNMG